MSPGTWGQCPHQRHMVGVVQPHCPYPIPCSPPRAQVGLMDALSPRMGSGGSCGCHWVLSQWEGAQHTEGASGQGQIQLQHTDSCPIVRPSFPPHVSAHGCADMDLPAGVCVCAPVSVPPAPTPRLCPPARGLHPGAPTFTYAHVPPNVYPSPCLEASAAPPRDSAVPRQGQGVPGCHVPMPTPG